MVRLRRAIEFMVREGEFEKILLTCPFLERKKVRHDKDMVQLVMKDGVVPEGAGIPILMGLQSPSVMRDIIAAIGMMK